MCCHSLRRSTSDRWSRRCSLLPSTVSTHRQCSRLAQVKELSQSIVGYCPRYNVEAAHSVPLCATTGVVGMTSSLCARFPERSGALNGMVTMTEGVGKMLGPACAAPLFAWAISRRPASAFPSGAFLVFLGVCTLLLCLALLSLLLPHSEASSKESEEPTKACTSTLKTACCISSSGSTRTSMSRPAPEPARA